MNERIMTKTTNIGEVKLPIEELHLTFITNKLSMEIIKYVKKK